MDFDMRKRPKKVPFLPGGVGRRLGFTLVELMIAMVLVAAMTSIIYGLFVRTSDSLSDVEGLTQTLDRARFGLAHVRNDLQAAGSQASPNALVDPWVQPRVAGQVVQPLRVYTNWANDRAVYTVDGDVTAIGAANPGSAFSGFVVLGAYDFPQSFLVNNVQMAAPGATFDIEANERGLGRLIRIDPFDVEPEDAIDITAYQGMLQADMEARVLRIMDGEGYMQFSAVSSLDASTSPAVLTASPVQFRQPGQMSGIEEIMEGDVGLDVALLDAFWYRVRPDPQDASNFQLVRHRLDAGQLITTPNLTVGALVGMTVSTLVIVDQVVDFRVWFDCADGAGVVGGVPWQTTWTITGAGGGCLDGVAQPELARVAHIRLSLRTAGENSNRPHLDLLNANWRGFEAANGQMITYDLAPHAEGSASVVTVQTSVELTNFAMRGLP